MGRTNEVKNRIEILGRFMGKLKRSGYQERERREILESGLK